MVVRFRRARPDGSRDEIVDVRRQVPGLLRAVHRSPDQEPRADERPHRGRIDRVAAQMHSIGSARERHIQTVVHDHSRVAATCGRDDLCDELREVSPLEISLADLDDVDACRDAVSGLTQKAASDGGRGRGARSELAAIGDQMENQGSTCVSGLVPYAAGGRPGWSAASDRARTVNIGMSSAKPAIRLTTPRPLTAPRAKLLETSARRAGHTVPK